jgi:hypothetical protein
MEFTLAAKKAKSDRRLKEYDLLHCGSKHLEKIGNKKVEG